MDLLSIFGGLLIVVTMIVIALRRGLQMRKLVLDGEIAEAKVVKKFKISDTEGAASSGGYLRYEYSDEFGKKYSYKSLVNDEQWNTHNVGDSMEVIYVKSNPKISGPKYIVDLAREALEKKTSKSSRAE
jgi:hypothetical protein